MTSEDMRRLLHRLEVQQTELERQNDEQGEITGSDPVIFARPRLRRNAFFEDLSGAPLTAMWMWT